MKTEERLYFAYGEREPGVLGGIIRRPVLAKEVREARLPSAKLFVQNASRLSEAIRAPLSRYRTDEQMRRLGFFMAKPALTEEIEGWVTPVTPQELTMIDNYDLVHRGLMRRVDDLPIILGRGVDAATVHFAGDHAGWPAPAEDVFGPQIPTRLNNVRQTIEVAIRVGEDFLAGRPQ